MNVFHAQKEQAFCKPHVLFFQKNPLWRFQKTGGPLSALPIIVTWRDQTCQNRDVGISRILLEEVPHAHSLGPSPAQFRWWVMEMKEWQCPLPAPSSQTSGLEAPTNSLTDPQSKHKLVFSPCLFWESESKQKVTLETFIKK